MTSIDRRTFGLALIGVASVLWSTAGLFVRLIDLDLWTMLAWRSFFAALSLLLVVLIQNGSRSRKALFGIGWPGLAAIPISAISMFCYVAALKLTTVANVLTVYATVPFIAAGLAYVWMGERAKPRVIWASLVALVGILAMAGSATRPQDIAGNALALLMTATFGIVLVMARRYPSLGMAPVNAFAAALCALACWPLASPIVPSAYQLVLLALFGATTTALAYLLFLIGGRSVPSGEAGLVALVDVVLGPLWVWLAFAEQPGLAALIGGGLVLAAVAWFLSAELGAPKIARRL